MEGTKIKGHNWDHGRGDICKKCGKVHVHGKPWLNKRHTEKTKKKMSTSHLGQVPWDKGKTKETDSRIARAAEKRSKTMTNPDFFNPSWWKKGHETWNKGLTKETDPRIAKYAEKLIGHPPANPYVFNEWREKFGIVTTYPKLRYIDDLGHGVRSTWEEWFGRELKKLGISYSYESKTYIVYIENKRHRYTPDFRLFDLIVEIKGHLTERCIMIVNEFIKQYSQLEYLMIGTDGTEKRLECKVIPWTKKESAIKWIKDTYL